MVKQICYNVVETIHKFIWWYGATVYINGELIIVKCWNGSTYLFLVLLCGPLQQWGPMMIPESISYWIHSPWIVAHWPSTHDRIIMNQSTKIPCDATPHPKNRLKLFNIHYFSQLQLQYQKYFWHTLWKNCDKFCFWADIFKGRFCVIQNIIKNQDI